MVNKTSEIGLNNSDIWCTVPKVSNPLTSIGFDYKNRLILVIRFRKNEIELEINDKCKVNGCPMALCTDCINFKKLDWNEIYNKHIKEELEK